MTRLLPPILLTAAILLGWEIACRMLQVPPWFLPPPSAVATALIARAPLLAARRVWGLLGSGGQGRPAPYSCATESGPGTRGV